MARNFKDQSGAGTTLNGAHSSGATSLTVTDGSIFSTTGPFSIRIENASTPTTYEVVNVTSRSGNVLTTAATTLGWANGDKVFQVVAKTDLDDFQSKTEKGAASGYGSLNASARQPAAEMSFIGCRLTKTAHQTLTTATEAALTWDAETVDTNGFHDNVTNNSRVTIPAGMAGWYEIEALIRYAANATGVRYVTYRKNGAATNQYAYAEPLSSGSATVLITDKVLLAVGDYIEIAAYQSSGGNLDVTYDFSTHFNVRFLGA